ncbi:type II toxin-antitoxin system death-on-curing family toxin [bacterium]|nr:type II toxin-antitoxin system death-on-curing family toxin [bacterium]
MKTISLSQILSFHEKIVLSTGGSSGVKDIKLIESALNRGLATFDGNYLYESLELKIAAITHSLISNHGFVDGNKRVGVSVMLLLLNLNRIEINYSQEELINLGLSVASGVKNEKDIFSWIKNHVIKSSDSLTS